MEKPSEQNGSDILLLWISVAALAGDSGRGGLSPLTVQLSFWEVGDLSGRRSS
jgi:hypothetical protein